MLLIKNFAAPKTQVHLSVLSVFLRIRVLGEPWTLCIERSSADTSILFTDSLVKTLDEDFARIDNEYADMAMYPTSGTSCMRPMMRETGKDDKMQGSLPQRDDEAKPSHRKSYDAVLSQSVKAKAEIRQPFALR